MRLKRSLSILTIGLGFSVAAAARLQQVAALSSSPRYNSGYEPVNPDIYKMPNADAQYYKKYQYGIR